MTEAEPQLEREVRSGYRVVVAFDHKRRRQSARATTSSASTLRSSARCCRPTRRVHVRRGAHGRGIRLALAQARRDPVAEARPPAVSRAAPTVRGTLASMADLAVGDHVVHQDHGIARFAGFETKTVAGVTRDYLELEYRGEDRVFAPTEQLAKITPLRGRRRRGAAALGAGLEALGLDQGARQARRAGARGRPARTSTPSARRGAATRSAPDSEWSIQLEQAFPYRETADQLEAIEATRADMESERPMDRLICGDVGYGKTEVALRAAAKAAGEGKQVMILVPTTVLAQQHLGTFRERFAELPFEVEAVSRLRKPAEVQGDAQGDSPKAAWTS